MRTVWVGAFLLSLCAPAAAQSAKDFTPAGAFITAPIAKELGQARADEFVKAASSAGFTSKETRLIARALREATIAVVDASASAWRQTFKTPHGSVTVSTIEQGGLVQRAMGYLPYPDFFDRYGMVRLSLAGATNYAVTIDGEKCPPTLMATYLVPANKQLNVSVTRAGKPACNWSGTVGEMKEHVIACGP